MKFGGTSVASPERLQNVAKRVIARKREGNDVVAVACQSLVPVPERALLYKESLNQV